MLYSIPETGRWTFYTEGIDDYEVVLRYGDTYDFRSNQHATVHTDTGVLMIGPTSHHPEYMRIDDEIPSSVITDTGSLFGITAIPYDTWSQRTLSMPSTSSSPFDYGLTTLTSTSSYSAEYPPLNDSTSGRDELRGIPAVVGTFDYTSSPDLSYRTGHALAPSSISIEQLVTLKTELDEMKKTLEEQRSLINFLIDTLDDKGLIRNG